MLVSKLEAGVHVETHMGGMGLLLTHNVMQCVPEAMEIVVLAGGTQSMRQRLQLEHIWDVLKTPVRGIFRC